VSVLFSPCHMRGLELANRIAVSPMCQYASDNGIMNDWHLMHYGQFAMGAAGLLFTEATHVSEIGRITPKCAGLWSDDQEADLKRIVDFCKTYGVAATGIQLAHAGRKASTHPPLKGGAPMTGTEGAWETLAPSPLPYGPDWPVPRELDKAGMNEIKQQFVDAARRCIGIGFDTIELHAGHGYLLNQFFSPLSNHRTDEYGGDVHKRIRYPLEVFEAIRKVWPDDKPLGLRVSAVDWVEGGTKIEDTIAFAQALEEIGCDYIDITSGGVDSRQKIKAGPGYQTGFASAVKKSVNIPVMAVGMITQAQQAEDVIARGDADIVMLARGMMYDPRWAWHAAKDLGAETTYPPQYIRCSPEYWELDRRE
jgi:2,4-dienoyl-CoA reductase-like NADH-dependent reductase (Old Yellow Enzyme family)